MLASGATLQRLGSTAKGLDSAEAARRLAAYGPNRLRPPRRISWWRILLRQMRSILVVVLFAAAAVALLLGEGLEAAAIGAVLLLNTVLGFVLELGARRRMEALLRFDVPHARVHRDDRVVDVDASQLVPGDVILLAAGDRIPADARLLGGSEVSADESALTGESAPARKSADWTGVPETPLPDRRNLLHSGTILTAGNAQAVVVATGMSTEVGRIGTLMESVSEADTPLQRRLERLGRQLAWIAGGMALVVASVGLLQGTHPRQVMETAIALAIAAVPEGLPVVATIALSVGLVRMARRNAVIRHLHAVEALGSTTVVCTDKTGTLTGGHMTVRELRLADHIIHVTGTGYEPRGGFVLEGEAVRAQEVPGLVDALRVASLSARARLVESPGGWSVKGDPTDGALLVLAHKAPFAGSDLTADGPAVADIPFTAERPLTASLHRDVSGALIAHVKGAPSFVLKSCVRVLTGEGPVPLTPGLRDRFDSANDQMAKQGMRVIALAMGPVSSNSPDALHDLTFVALAGLIDPPAEGVADTIARFRDAGIRTAMLTGDQRLTAEAIAAELGLLEPGHETLDGAEIGRLSDDELSIRVRTCDVFSRISPTDKLRIVDALQRNGEIVAVIGDGVNDAAALKRAHAGVAMGIRGTDVAKEAASVVLQDDRFPTIVAAIEEGRVIYDNIRKFVFYLFSCNLAEVLVLFVAGVAGMPLPLLPLQILWLNLVTDTFPALALAVEPAEPNIMRRPPVHPGAAILSARFLRGIGVFALLITGSTIAAFTWGLHGGGGPASYTHAVTLSFMTLGLAQLFHLGDARSRHDVLSPHRMTANRHAIGAVVLVVLLQCLAVYTEPLATVLGTQPLKARDWAVVLPLAAFPAVVGQARRVRKRGAPI
ncbi:MAG TPA: HAD-IC family P-type ATPase [Longimicrobiales bacterium]|nr:HAD-IC family P-type ATPase [Longimicrobiales bacterium]